MLYNLVTMNIYSSVA